MFWTHREQRCDQPVQAKLTHRLQDVSLPRLPELLATDAAGNKTASSPYACTERTKHRWANNSFTINSQKTKKRNLSTFLFHCQTEEKRTTFCGNIKCKQQLMHCTGVWIKCFSSFYSLLYSNWLKDKQIHFLKIKSTFSSCFSAKIIFLSVSEPCLNLPTLLYVLSLLVGCSATNRM